MLLQQSPWLMTDQPQMDAVSSLRQELPALGLTAGFATPQIRPVYADLMLLWLEVNRARAANENLIAAARLTWWRDVIAENKPEGVPLAMRLLEYKSLDQSQLTAGLTNLIDVTINSSPEAKIEAENQCHLIYGKILSAILGGDALSAGQVLINLKASLAGKPSDIEYDVQSLPKVLRLVDWLTQDPMRLHYPEAKPMLALSMIFAAIRL